MQADHEPAPALSPLEHPDGRGGSLVALKEGWTPVNIEGPRENSARHRFSSVEGFVAWLRHWTKNPGAAQVFANLPRTVFGDGDGTRPWRRLEASIDPRDPGSDRVTGSVELDPAFSAWAALSESGRQVGQKAFFDFLRSWGDSIENEAERVSLFSALAALKVTTGGSFEAELAANGRLKVSGMRGEVSVSQEIPAEFKIRGPIFQTRNAAAYSVRVVLDVEAGPAGVSIAVSMPGIETIIAEANEDLVAYVAKELGDAFLVCAGASLFELEPTGDRTRASDFDRPTADDS